MQHSDAHQAWTSIKAVLNRFRERPEPYKNRFRTIHWFLIMTIQGCPSLPPHLKIIHWFDVGLPLSTSSSKDSILFKMSFFAPSYAQKMIFSTSSKGLLVFSWKKSQTSPLLYNQATISQPYPWKGERQATYSQTGKEKAPTFELPN